MSDKPSPKPWINAIHAYVPGKAHADDGRELVKLSANENPLGSSPAALAAFAKARAPAGYPDPDSGDLRAAIGELHDIDPARIVCGTGSDELLNLAAQAYAGPGDEVLFSNFSFAVYEIAARRCGATPIIAPDKDYGTDVDALIAAATDKTRVVFVANPNNPTGSYLPASEIARLHAALPADVLFVLDQAYAEYLTAEEDDGGLTLVADTANVLVTRTFSKIYGLAGERIGWATGHPDIIGSLNRIRGPFNVTNHGQAAALAAVGDQAFVTASREHNAAELARFVEVIEGLGNHGLRPLPSKANFLLVLFEGNLTAEQAYKALADGGYATRWLPGAGLPHGLRITIGTSKQMADVTRILRELTETAQ
ncbi:histidinol-phosphate transaminase [Pontixanthobacter aestiaquae]|uniref:Histidinol-phosphate aminotransferase n=1 Tax=Pontixanthobacter aestiaquae TaxID=1509367 RepID=A0A844ZB33_9SPHN|nr:histidinol-phosphate transaminase [Pontixanthobacter aestiaquae]MDN3644587.1 histidinol-phosphate transaminase [Pontixanthobacter aestiaquae]MXO84406.1 histidinol-phosphate transaminase [Pontixanthobacter aestiaquae]